MARGKHLNCPVCGANVWAPHSVLSQHWQLGTVELCEASNLTLVKAQELKDFQPQPIKQKQECRNTDCGKQWEEETIRAFCPYCGCSMVRARESYASPF